MPTRAEQDTTPMNTTPPVNMPTPPVVTVHYAPSTDPETAPFPWLIAADRAPLTRISEPRHAVDTLQALPQITADGWDLHPAVHHAITDTAPGKATEAAHIPADTRDLSEEQGTGYAVIYAPADTEAPGRYPWILLDPAGHPVARTAEGEHALDALQALPELLDQGTDPADAVGRALDAARVFIWDTYTEAEEVQP